NALSVYIGFVFDQQPFFSWFFLGTRNGLAELIGHRCPLRTEFVSFDPVIWRNDLFSIVDLPQSFAVIWINQTEFQLRHARELIARFLDLGGVESWDLHQNAVVRDGTDYRLPGPQHVYTHGRYTQPLCRRASV